MFASRWKRASKPRPAGHSRSYSSRSATSNTSEEAEAERGARLRRFSAHGGLKEKLWNSKHSTLTADMLVNMNYSQFCFYARMQGLSVDEMRLLWEEIPTLMLSTPEPVVEETKPKKRWKERPELDLEKPSKPPELPTIRLNRVTEKEFNQYCREMELPMKERIRKKMYLSEAKYSKLERERMRSEHSFLAVSLRNAMRYKQLVAEDRENYGLDYRVPSPPPTTLTRTADCALHHLYLSVKQWRGIKIKRNYECERTIIVTEDAALEKLHRNWEKRTKAGKPPSAADRFGWFLKKIHYLECSHLTAPVTEVEKMEGEAMTKLREEWTKPKNDWMYQTPIKVIPKGKTGAEGPIGLDQLSFPKLIEARRRREAKLKSGLNKMKLIAMEEGTERWALFYGINHETKERAGVYGEFIKGKAFLPNFSRMKSVPVIKELEASETDDKAMEASAADYTLVRSSSMTSVKSMDSVASTKSTKSTTSTKGGNKSETGSETDGNDTDASEASTFSLSRQDSRLRRRASQKSLPSKADRMTDTRAEKKSRLLMQRFTVRRKVMTKITRGMNEMSVFERKYLEAYRRVLSGRLQIFEKHMGRHYWDDEQGRAIRVLGIDQASDDHWHHTWTRNDYSMYYAWLKHTKYTPEEKRNAINRDKKLLPFDMGLMKMWSILPNVRKGQYTGIKISVWNPYTCFGVIGQKETPESWSDVITQPTATIGPKVRYIRNLGVWTGKRPDPDKNRKVVTDENWRRFNHVQTAHENQRMGRETRIPVNERFDYWYRKILDRMEADERVKRTKKQKQSKIRVPPSKKLFFWLDSRLTDPEYHLRVQPLEVEIRVNRITRERCSDSSWNECKQRLGEKTQCHTMEIRLSRAGSGFKGWIIPLSKEWDYCRVFVLPDDPRNQYGTPIRVEMLENFKPPPRTKSKK